MQLPKVVTLEVCPHVGSGRGVCADKPAFLANHSLGVCDPHVVSQETEEFPHFALGTFLFFLDL